MTRCKYCGGPVEWKDNRGWFREFCEACAQAVADGQDLRSRFDPGDAPEDPDRPWEVSEA